MMPASASLLFSSAAYQEIETKITNFLNAKPYFLSPHTAQSPRSAGDAVQSLLEENMELILGEQCAKYEKGFSRRAMEDIAFTDKNGLRYLVDVKTHWTDAKFSMPNLISLPRLTKLYENDANYFVLLLVRYRAEPDRITVTETHFVPIEFLSWSCLTIGALGAGQIQIASASRIVLEPNVTRRDWMLALCDRAQEFYRKELVKTNHRLVALQNVRVQWEGKAVDTAAPINDAKETT